MKLTLYQIDAFAEKSFQGNPAAVVPLTEWLPDAMLQAIAEENNLAETAFFVPVEDHFYIRWFTPNKEVALCGHATLASAYVLFNILGFKQGAVSFDSLSGGLSVSKKGELLTLDFPAQPPEVCDFNPLLAQALGTEPKVCLAHDDYLAVFETEEEVASLKPNQQLLMQLDRRGVIATAPSTDYDFVVRFFAPKYGIPEDSVTGSAYTYLMPYWVNKLGKSKLNARQISARGGNVFCELKGDRVLITGTAVKYLEGTIEV